MAVAASTTSCLLSMLLLFSISLSSSSDQLPKPGFITLPIRADSTTHQYYTSIAIGTPRHPFHLALDLSGRSLWYDCDARYNSSTYAPLPCASPQCPHNSPCIGCNNFPTKPGCTNNTCGFDIVNPFADTIFSGDLGRDLLYLQGLKVPGRFISACTDSERFTSPLLVGLAKGIRGVIGLARGTPLTLPLQISSNFNVIPKFTLCLPSSPRQIGKILIGPFSVPNSVSSSRVPLANPPSASENEYYISVNSITIDGKTVNFTKSLLSVTKISTMAPYTVLHHSIYKPLVRGFVKAAAEKKMKRVRSVAPFGACFDAKTVGKSDVPRVELVLDRQGGVSYGIDGHNSMVEVKKGVTCLGLVDGGKKAEAGIVIGGKQMEDRILEFDLSMSLLTFTDSLRHHSKTCSDSLL